MKTLESTQDVPREFAASAGCIFQVEITPRAGSGVLGVGGLLDTVQLGDNVAVLAALPAECVDLVVTSPPYDDLRTYGGHSWDFAGVARELTRVLKPGGVIVWVVADATVDGSETLTSMRQAIHFKDVCGLNVHDTMTYVKKAPVPLTHNRYEQAWEYMVVLSKGRPSRWNPLTEPCLSAGLPNRMTHRRLSDELTDANGKGRAIKAEKYRNNCWEYQKENEGSEHPASFPLKLAKEHVLSWSNPGDVVLDPFSGSGTTCKAAKELNRHWLGIEINPAYVEISRVRLAQDVLMLFPTGGGGGSSPKPSTAEEKYNTQAHLRSEAELGAAPGSSANLQPPKKIL